MRCRSLGESPSKEGRVSLVLEEVWFLWSRWLRWMMVKTVMMCGEPNCAIWAVSAVFQAYKVTVAVARLATTRMVGGSCLTPDARA